MTSQANAYRPTYHRDGTVTIWSVYQQRWLRVSARKVSDRELAAMPEAWRARILRMAATAR